jgi:hypothetical protein
MEKKEINESERERRDEKTSEYKFRKLGEKKKKPKERGIRVNRHEETVGYKTSVTC